MPFSCPHCHFIVKSERGLRQHINGTSSCCEKDRVLAGGRLQTCCKVKNHFVNPNVNFQEDAGDVVTKDEVTSRGTSKKQHRTRFYDDDHNSGNNSRKLRRKDSEILGQMEKNIAQMIRTLRCKSRMDPLRSLQEGEAPGDVEAGYYDDDERGGELVDLGSDNDDDEQLPMFGPEDRPDERDPWLWNGVDPTWMNPPQAEPVPAWYNLDPNNDKHVNIQPNTTMRAKFQAYTKKYGRLMDFTKSQKRSIRLLDTLRRKKAPLDTYEEVMEWYHREKGDINEHESLMHVNNVDNYISRKEMIATLKERYNMGGKFPHKKVLHLPNSKANVTLTLHNAWDCIESLLTDPRVRDEDYCFHDNNPFAAPPPYFQGNVGDLHTGMAYALAHGKYITKPNQVLLPITMYIDGAVTGQFANLPITALKMSLGIHNRKFRDKEYAWRTLGMVAQVSKAKSRGKRLYRNSGHVDSQNMDLDGQEGQDDATKEVCKAQDYHAMLECILESYLDVQTNGFIWDLRYRGETYKDVEFVPFLMFIKCDTDEADVLCGSYKSRGAGVAQLCRYCTCPTMESDCVNADFPVKTVPTIAALVEAENLEGLRRISQQLIKNAWYKIRFTPKCDQGIHGACPSEMLHALLLGIFKYTRDCFFEQIGPTSALAAEINSLAQQYGDHFARHSERDMPKCKFNQGIQKGKLMAMEFRGILLVIAAVLRSAKGQEILAKNPNFKDPRQISNWGWLVELLLEWEAYLNEPEMSYGHIMSMRLKNRFIMYMIKKVARRHEGMGWKLMKFHVLVHLWLDIALYGVPKEVDTGSNESHHKGTKVAARLTQKNEATFDFQTCTRLDEFLLIDLAMAEMEGDKMWSYYSREADEIPEDLPHSPPPSTSGLVINVFQIDGKLEYSVGSGPKSKIPTKAKWDDELLLFLGELGGKLGNKPLQIRGTHTREGIIFRGSPKYRGVPWRDWAMFDWGGPNSTLPGQIWCFVIIDSLGSQNEENIQHGGIRLEDGHYAVIECADYGLTPKEMKLSDIFISINKEVGQTADGDRPWRRKFYLATVESIVRPLVVVPNIGGKRGFEFFIVRQREEWVEEFKVWLDQSHDKDVIGQEEPIPSHDVT